jgi:hypothetical protein
MKKILKLWASLTMLAGITLVIAGSGGVLFTYRSISQEKIVTPADSSIPNRPVRGPLTLQAQASTIRKHALKMTNNQTYAEMPRQITKIDENGKSILDKDGKPVMVPNATRDIWVTATTLTTALNMGILAYAFAGLTILIGCISIGNGILFYRLSKSTKFA